MYNVPINRWTIAAILGLAAWLGGDIFTTVAKVVGLLAMPYVPAA